MTLSVGNWTFASGGAVTAIPTDVDDPTLTAAQLRIREGATVTATGERITAVYVDLRNAANTATLATASYTGLNAATFDAFYLGDGLGFGTAYTIRVRAQGTVTGLGVLGSRAFRFAMAEIVYPVSLGVSATGIALSGQALNPTNAGFAVAYAPATGPLTGDKTGAWSTDPPSSSPTYVHIRIRLGNQTKLERMDLAWRAS